MHCLDVGDWSVATNPPPAVGGPMLAVMLAELARRGEWTWAGAIEIQHAVLSYRTGVHDLSRDLDHDGRALLETVAEHGLHAARPGTRLASNMAPTTARTAGGRPSRLAPPARTGSPPH